METTVTKVCIAKSKPTTLGITNTSSSTASKCSTNMFYQ